MCKAALLLLPTVLVLASCAELRWQKPGADAGMLSADFEACRTQAQVRIGRAIGPAIPSASDPRFGADISQPSPTDRRIQEQQLADRCMRDKGYTLVPGVKTEDR